MSDPQAKALVFSIVQYLSTLDGENEEVGVATQCLSEAFSLDVTDASQIAEYSVLPHTLLQIFEAGKAALKDSPAARQAKEVQGKCEPILSSL